MAWAAGAAGPAALDDPVTAAATMLVLHDLARAQYPLGRLDVDALGPSSVSGFGAATDAVLSTARELKAEALAHAGFTGPARIDLIAGPDGAPVASVLDANGVPIPDVPVAVEVQGITATASADLPDLTLRALASSTTPAQRVALPSIVHLEASTSLAPPNGWLTIRKRDPAGAALAGARFAIVDPNGETVVEVTTDATGSATADVAPGRYAVVEQVAPPGYATSAPLTADVAPATEVELVVVDQPLAGSVVVRKVDAASGALVAGAALELRRDTDGDGTYDQVVARLGSAAAPVRVENLAPGSYELVEQTPPVGYLLGPPARGALRPGGELALTIADTVAPTTTTTVTTTTTTTPSTPTATTTPAPPTTVLGGPPAERPPLARTGAPTGALAELGAGFVLLGCALVPRRQRALAVCPSE